MDFANKLSRRRRKNSFSAIVGDKIYIAGGGNYCIVYRDFWVYDISQNSWTQLANMPLGGRVGGISYALDSMVYFGMGHNYRVGSKDLWRFDTRTQIWTRLADFPGTARMQSTILYLNGKFIVGGGHELGVGTAKSDYFVYDLQLNQWSSISVPSAAATRSNATFVSDGNTAYVIGGYSGPKTSMSMRNDVWEIFYRTTSELELIPIKNYTFYPNPVEDQLQIQWMEKTSPIIELYDLKGRLLFTERIHMGVNSLRLNIDHSGLMLYRIISDGKIAYSGKLFKK